MKKSGSFLKKIGKVLLIILAIIFIAVAALFLYGKWQGSRPLLADRYWEDYQTECVLEEKYTGSGAYDVSSSEYASEDKNILQFKIWYPTELETSDRAYPLVVIANASGMAASRYEPFFEHLASWGFVVVGTEDRNTNSGASCAASLDFVLELQSQETNIFYRKIDTENIGIAGYSQGGVGAIKAVTTQENGHYYKAIFTGSAANPTLSEAMGWGYDASKIDIPYFMTAGTLKQDTGEDGGIGVAPLSSLIENYDAITADVLKVRARASNADHEDMLAHSDGYMVAWMLYQLRGDAEAGNVFVGENAELLHNANWQDVQISK